VSFLSFFRRFCALVCATILLNFIVSTASTAPQAVTVDPTFAPLLQDFGSVSNRPSVHVSALQPDGKILVGGVFTVASGLARSGIARFNADGTPDPTFDAGNIGVAETILTVTTGGTIETIKVQPDGKILIGGSFRREDETVVKTIERLNADGSLDTSFQSAIVDAIIGDLEVQADGKIVVGGNFWIITTNPANGQSVTFKHLARLNPNGSFDFTFTGNGDMNSNNIVIQPDGKIVVGDAPTNADPYRLVRYNTNGTVDTVLTTFDDWVTGLELLPDGKFVVVGWFDFVNDNFQRRITRLNANGTQDASFASSVQSVNSLYFSDVSIQPDGKAIVCGEFSFIDSFTRWRVARFNTDGSIDQTFNTSTPIAGVVSEVQALPDGKVFIGGAFPLPSNNEFYNNIGRLNADGSIDTNFNFANVIFEGEGYSIVQQPDGKVLVGGFLYYANNRRSRGIARYNTDGTLDLGFVPSTNLAYVLDIALQPDGKILVVNADSPSSLFRLNADGSQDTSFNAPFVPFSASIQKRTRITQILLQPDGKILVGGQLITGSATSPTLSGLARLNPDGSRDTTFQLVGALGGTRDVHDIALQPDGKIIIGGDFTHINNNSAFHYVARVNADGTPDATFSSPFPPSPIAVVYEIELQPDGKVVYAGNFDFVLRVNSNGSPDDSFSVPVNNIVQALTLQPSGKILVGGYFTSINNATRKRIARLNPDGSLDAGFDPPNGANNIVYDFFNQTDGKILVAGAFTKLGNQERIGAARLIDNASAPSRAAYDFDGDGKADISVYRNGTWHLQQSSNGYAAMQFGLANDKLTPADFDGDGKTDLAVYRDGVWYLQRSQSGFTSLQFGIAGDTPQAADFDGDGKSEVAVYRASSGTWYIYNLANNQVTVKQFGIAEDKPVAGDFDGDGKADLAIFRPSTGDWWWQSSIDNAQRATRWGISTDILVPADYDGDGKMDFAVYRDGTWYVMRSRDGVLIQQFGISEDIPTAADYDGDGKADIAVFRPSNGVWYLNRSQSGMWIQQFGLTNDVPIPQVFAR
jgi:uncharacterized delta-60 repeat protein